MKQGEPVFSLIGGDPRMHWARQFLEAAGCSFGPPEAATYVILPLPALDGAGCIRGGPPLEEALSHIKPGTTVLGGQLGRCREALEATGARVVDYFRDETLTAANAGITAEGAVGMAMTSLPVTLSGTPVLVTGWGRIGQLLAGKLRALGAQVTVSARRERDLGMIQAMGYSCARTGHWQDLGPYRAIFNTVPAPVFTPEDLMQVRPDCLLLELASAPGGIPADGSRTVVHASGLPGKTAPETAGRLIGETILRLVSERSHYAG